MVNENIKGQFIVLDGPDGCGKSTQIRVLADVLRGAGVEVLAVRDPGGTRIGDQIRAILLNADHVEMDVRSETLLYMASRAQLWAEVIRPALAKGVTVLCDRWVSSTYAYQAVAGKIGPELVLQLAESTLERTWPDKTIIIDYSSEDGLKRAELRAAENAGKPSKDNDLSPKELDRMELKSAQFHQDVRQAFLDLAKIKADEMVVVSGAGTIDEVHERVCEVIAGL